MIVEWLLALLKALLTALLFFLPSYAPPPGVGLSVLAAADFVLPLSELGLVMGAVVAYSTAGLLYTAVMRIVKLVRGAG